jgi:hypothetical protein
MQQAVGFYSGVDDATLVSFDIAAAVRVAVASPGALAASPFGLLDASSSLRFVTDVVHEDDVLCLALTCRALRDALWALYPAGQWTAAGRLWTRARPATRARLLNTQTFIKYDDLAATRPLRLRHDAALHGCGVPPRIWTSRRAMASSVSRVNWAHAWGDAGARDEVACFARALRSPVALIWHWPTAPVLSAADVYMWSAGSGLLSVLQWALRPGGLAAHAAHPFYGFAGDPAGILAFWRHDARGALALLGAAAGGGHLCVVRWLWGVAGAPLRAAPMPTALDAHGPTDQGRRKGEGRHGGVYDDVVINGGIAGRVDFVRWQKGVLHPGGSMDRAAAGGHVDVLQFLYSNVCCAIPSGSTFSKWAQWMPCGRSQTLCVSAAQGRGGPRSPNALRRSRSGRFAFVLLDGLQRFCIRTAFPPPRPCARRFGGHVAVLEWLLDRACPWTDRCPRAVGCAPGTLECEAAAYGGHVAVLACLRARGASWGDGAAMCSSAARGGHRAVLAHVYAAGCPLDACSSMYAGHHGDVSMLRWIREQRGPWDARTCACAALEGHLELLQYAVAASCPWSRIACLRCVSRRDVRDRPHSSLLRLPTDVAGAVRAWLMQAEQPDSVGVAAVQAAADAVTLGV